MNERVNPELLVLARESRGLTQKQLSEALRIEQYEISRIENGYTQKVPEGLVQKLARSLRYPVDFFYQDFKVYPLWLNYYRKHKTLPAKDLKRIAALLNIYRERVRRLLVSVDIDSIQIPQLTVEQYGSPEEIARYVRSILKLPRGRIENVTDVLERFGIVIIPFDFGVRKFSGASLFLDNSATLLFLNKMPADRCRHTLAHELGHLVMHALPDPDADIEREADQFAAEFLMPASDIKHQLSNLTLEKLAALKLHWRSSMASILFRAHALGMLNEHQYKRFWERFSKRGYRTSEPPELEPPLETPHLLKEMVDFHREDLAFSVDEIAATALLHESDFESCYLPVATGLRLVA